MVIPKANEQNRLTTRDPKQDDSRQAHYSFNKLKTLRRKEPILIEFKNPTLSNFIPGLSNMQLFNCLKTEK
ncbi:hypothetical protein, partial [Nitrosomonas sp.]|uniref:hypothetical protein n=1 Tax=Nitrosomonas sp. TaxID=42353 RepID=UPI00330609B8